MAFETKSGLVMALLLMGGLAACQTTTAGTGGLYGNSVGIDRVDRGVDRGRVLAQQPYRDRSGRVLYPTSDGRVFYSARERDFYLADLRQSRSERISQRERELARREARQRELERREARQRELDRREARERELARAEARQRQRDLERQAARERERRDRIVREDRSRNRVSQLDRQITAAEEHVSEARRAQVRAQRVLERRRAAGANTGQARGALRNANANLAQAESALNRLRQRQRQGDRGLRLGRASTGGSDYEAHRRRGESREAYQRRVQWAQSQANKTGMSVDRILREGRGPDDGK